MTVAQEMIGLSLSSADRSQIVLSKVKGNLTCAEFARQLKVEYYQVWRCLNGSMMTVKIAYQLSRYIGCSMDDIAQLIFPVVCQHNPSPF